MKSKLLLLNLVLVFLLLTIGCSKKNEKFLDSEITGSSNQVVLFPHNGVWKSEHISYMAGSKSSGGEPQCLQCHQSNLGSPREVNCTTACHKVDDQIPQPAPRPIPVPNKCVTCHESVIQNKYAHYPANAGLCSTCHEVSDKHIRGESDPVKTKDTANDCYRCHNRKDTEPVVHPAMKFDQSCITCHNPHGGDQRFFIQAESTKSLCLMCHDGAVPVDAAIKHGPAHDQKSCVNCHNPHSSKNEKLLRLPSKELCLSCHDKPIQATLSDVRVIPNIKAKLEQASSQHTGAIMGDCTMCHNPHGSENNRLLSENYSVSNYNEYPGKGANPYAMCFTCHDPDMLKEKDFKDNTNFRDEKKNYHWSHVVDAGGAMDKTQGKSCRICHDPHGSNQDFNINESWNMNGNEINIKYTSSEKGGKCTYSCHDVKSYEREEE